MKEESKLIELFKKYPGIAARIRRSFAYHYDQIQREIESEVATINKDDAATIIDYTTEYMEESMNQVYIPHQDKWNEHFPTPGKPNPNYYTDSGATFNKHLRTQNKLKSKQK